MKDYLRVGLEAVGPSIVARVGRYQEQTDMTASELPEQKVDGGHARNGESQSPQTMDRWISVYSDAGVTVASVFEANTDSSATELRASQHRGPMALLSTRLWALPRYGRLKVRRL